MTRVAVLVTVALVPLTACGGEGDEAPLRPPETTAPAGGGLSLTVRHPEPLRRGGAVTWTLEVRNDGTVPVTLVFPSGQHGDVVLRQAGGERYRWSRGRAFTQVLAEMPLRPGEARSFDLREQRLDVAPGDYELVASMTSRPAPPQVRETVAVR